MNLDEIKVREEKATPGPWVADYNEPFSGDFVGIYSEIDGYIIKAEDEDGGYSSLKADTQFIAHAREDIPVLISEVERLQNENAELRKALELAESDIHDLLYRSTDCTFCGEDRTNCEAAECSIKAKWRGVQAKEALQK